MPRGTGRGTLYGPRNIAECPNGPVCATFSKILSSKRNAEHKCMKNAEEVDHQRWVTNSKTLRHTGPELTASRTDIAVARRIV
jgi:hypothetical protein